MSDISFSQHAAGASELLSALASDQYMVRAKILSFLGQKFHIYDPQGNVIMFCKMKAFKLKEDIVLYASEAMERPLLQITARSVIDFSASYDVLDMTAGGQRVGVLRRKGMKSLIRDAWEMLDADEQPVANISEDGAIKALVRRFVDAASIFMPQAFHGERNGQRVFEMKQNLNPFVRKLDCDFSLDSGRTIDRRLGLAAAILLMAIEGKQN
jgi:uncharacterized protein YxjI